jgi:hypothetical protein
LLFDCGTHKKKRGTLEDNNIKTRDEQNVHTPKNCLPKTQEAL